MQKIDYKKQYKEIYTAKPLPKVIGVPELKYLSIDGYGDPNTSELFAKAIEALYSVSYTLKFTVKKSLMAIDYGVMPLEGLWWTDNMKEFNILDKSNWKWTAMIMQPEFITDAMVEDAKGTAFAKKGNEVIKSLKLSTIKEGLSAQIMHIGPYSAEADNIKKLHAFIKENGGEFDGLVEKHHEIYLSDMRKTAPEKLKTIIRQPFKQIRN